MSLFLLLSLDRFFFPAADLRGSNGGAGSQGVPVVRAALPATARIRPGTGVSLCEAAVDAGLHEQKLGKSRRGVQVIFQAFIIGGGAVDKTDQSRACTYNLCGLLEAATCSPFGVYVLSTLVMTNRYLQKVVGEFR